MKKSKKTTRRFAWSAALGLTAVLGGACGATSAFAQSDGVPWGGYDALGRNIVGQKPDDPARVAIRDDKTIGIFYFLWLDPTSIIPTDKNAPKDAPRPYDLTKILEKDPNAVRNENDALLGTNGQMHFWGEPLYGYYDSRDPWVVRRHMNLLADAGVDVLIFDTTNAVTYPHVYLPLCDLLLEMKADGETVPQIAFMTNTQVGPTTQKIWDECYSKEKYAPLFFHWEGKPLILSNPAAVPEGLRDKFTFRTAYWPTYGMKNTKDAWHWVDAYPQPYSWTKDEKTPEQVNVSTSQNLARDAAGLPVWMSRETARGRSFYVPEPDADGKVDFEKWRENPDPNVGKNYAQQWERAFELDPPFVFITGWNEWVAGRWKIGENRYMFVDQFNQEYSRDVEPSRGMHFDNYYWQTVDGIRKYKGTPDLPASIKEPTTISFAPDADFAQWAAVEPTFRDHVKETIPRDFPGVGGTHYRDASGRNDITFAKVARDAANVYFYVETREAIRPETPNGLCLGLDLDGDKTGWRGVDLLIGRSYSADGSVSAERFDAKNAPAEAAWKTSATVDGVRWKLDGNKLQISVPRTILSADFASFKWFDAIPFESPEDLYLKGDVAPESSFFYRADFDF